MIHKKAKHTQACKGKIVERKEVFIATKYLNGINFLKCYYFFKKGVNTLDLEISEK